MGILGTFYNFSKVKFETKKKKTIHGVGAGYREQQQDPLADLTAQVKKMDPANS